MFKALGSKGRGEGTRELEKNEDDATPVFVRLLFRLAAISLVPTNCGHSSVTDPVKLDPEDFYPSLK